MRRAGNGRKYFFIGNAALALLWALCAAPAFGRKTPAPSSNAKRVSFLNDVEPILTRAGCNQGACHGAQFGKGGFKLSLAGYDPDLDYSSLARQGRGRRANVASPAASLLLRKPTLSLPHQGGRALTPDSADYRTLTNWLRQGAPGPDPKDPHVTELRVTPARRVMQPRERQQVTMQAVYSDGSARDVTAHTRIHSLDDTIAAVTPDGVVTARSRGATAIMLRYAGLAAVAHIAVPYARAKPFSWIPNNYIDAYAARRWRDLGLAPSGLCSDTEFLRRVSLDVIGTLPTPEEIRAFLADTDPQKRTKAIERLLERPEYVDFWTQRWGDLLRSSRLTLGQKAMQGFTDWIRDSLRRNRPYDRFVHILLTAQGSSLKEPPANYYRVATTPQDLTETTAQLFLGIRLQCAKCHQHPFEKWSQRDYYQFAAFFARVGLSKTSTVNEEQTVSLLTSGEVVHPRTQERMAPLPLALVNGPQLASVATERDSRRDRRLALAGWLTSRDNLAFAQTVADRYWNALMGRGLVHPVDDRRITNPPSNPELMEALARDLQTHRFDLKRLIRVICASRVYQLSSRPTADNRADNVFHSRHLIKRQPAEVLLDSVCFATGSPETYPGLPPGTRAIQLPDSGTASLFLDTFGRPARATACECERTAEPDLPQALQLINGDLIHRKLGAKDGRIAKLLASGKSDREIIEELFLVTLSRPPVPSERTLALRAFQSAPDRRQAAEDLLWTLLNTKEFASIR